MKRWFSRLGVLVSVFAMLLTLWGKNFILFGLERYQWFILYCVCTLFFSITLRFSHPLISPILFWQTWLLSIVFPVYGWVASFVFACMSIYSKLSDKQEDEELEADTLLEVEGEDVSVTEKVKFQLGIQSYYDILRGSNDQLKKSLITKLLDRKHLSDVPLLKLALKDDSYEVRTYATTALSKFEKHLADEILIVKEKVEENTNSLMFQFSLLNKYYRYMISGFLDEAFLSFYSKEVDKVFKSIENEATLTPTTQLKIQYQKAKFSEFNPNLDDRIVLYEALLAKYPNQRKLLVKLAQVLYEKRDMVALKAVLSRLHRNLPKTHAIFPAVSVWMEAA